MDTLPEPITIPLSAVDAAAVEAGLDAHTDISPHPTTMHGTTAAGIGPAWQIRATADQLVVFTAALIDNLEDALSTGDSLDDDFHHAVGLVADLGRRTVVANHLPGGVMVLVVCNSRLVDDTMSVPPTDWVATAARGLSEQNAVDRLRYVLADDIADDTDVTDWQRGYRACSERVLAVLDEHPAQYPGNPNVVEREVPEVNHETPGAYAGTRTGTDRVAALVERFTDASDLMVSKADLRELLSLLTPRDEVTVFRAGVTDTWSLIAGPDSFAATDVNTVLVAAARLAIERPGLIIRYQDEGSISKRIAAKRAAQQQGKS